MLGPCRTSREKTSALFTGHEETRRGLALEAWTAAINFTSDRDAQHPKVGTCGHFPPWDESLFLDTGDLGRLK